jgi:hypothetical protein
VNSTHTAMEKLRIVILRFATEKKGPRMMDESKTPPTHLGSCRYLTLRRGVLDVSIIR